MLQHCLSAPLLFSSTTQYSARCEFCHAPPSQGEFVTACKPHTKYAILSKEIFISLAMSEKTCPHHFEDYYLKEGISMAHDATHMPFKRSTTFQNNDATEQANG